MTNAEREQLKDNLRAMAAGRGDGIDLNTQFRWLVKGIAAGIVLYQSPIIVACGRDSLF